MMKELVYMNYYYYYESVKKKNIDFNVPQPIFSPIFSPIWGEKNLWAWVENYRASLGFLPYISNQTSFLLCFLSFLFFPFYFLPNQTKLSINGLLLSKVDIACNLTFVILTAWL